MGLQANIQPRNNQYRIGGGTRGGGAVGACAPTLFYSGGGGGGGNGQCPHKIWVANSNRNVNTPPPVYSIIIHVDMVFCGE